jgi:predicted RND superfamily exporter protein
MNAGMGLMTALIITLALILVFLMLPPLLMKIEENETDASFDNDIADRASTA